MTIIKNQFGEFPTNKKNGHPGKTKSGVLINSKTGKARTGRPPKIDPEKPILENPVVQKLVEAFKLDSTIEEACAYADITKTTFYDHLEKNPAFAYEIEKARQFLKLLARKAVAKSIQSGDSLDSKWYLERKLKKEFSTRQELTGEDGNPINIETLLPSALLPKSKQKKLD